MVRAIILSFSILLIGCSSRVVYQDVYIPTKCTIKKEPRPKYEDDVEKNIENILIYNDTIAEQLKFCSE